MLNLLWIILVIFGSLLLIYVSFILVINFSKKYKTTKNPNNIDELLSFRNSGTPIGEVVEYIKTNNIDFEYDYRK